MDWLKLWLQMQVIDGIIGLIVSISFMIWVIVDIFKDINRK